MKKALILYDSLYGNTKKVAMSLSRGLESGGLYVDSSSIEDFETVKLNNYDIIGIGGPTHFHGASKKMKLFLLLLMAEFLFMILIIILNTSELIMVKENIGMMNQVKINPVNHIHTVKFMIYR